MKTSQFTTGPWRTNENTCVIAGHAEAPFAIAQVYMDSEANARLIAQAPAMYEALAAMVKQFEPLDPGADDGNSDCDALVNARSILNTINGKE